MENQKSRARLFGVFFILAFLSYGTGSGMIDSITSSPALFDKINSSRTILAVGVVLMFFVHSIVNIGLPVILMPVLKPYGKSMAYGYLSFGIAATVVVVLRSVFAVLLLPLADSYTAGGMQTELSALATVLIDGGNYTYQMSMALWGVGGVLLSVLLYTSQIVPRFFAVWGIAGYLVFIAGTILEIFQLKYGLVLSLPGGLFELALSGWLIVKGFSVNTEQAEARIGNTTAA